ncbi:hypothetical protein J6590_027739 [Homalodisca vitripennis]|nr:hypothetical protein J6590_027739 [Homalodisca vitripennis]
MTAVMHDGSKMTGRTDAEISTRHPQTEQTEGLCRPNHLDWLAKVQIATEETPTRENDQISSRVNLHNDTVYRQRMHQLAI